MKKLICLLITGILILSAGSAVFAEEPLNSETQEVPEPAAAEENGAAPVSQIDYLVLVNKLHPLPEGWEDILETVHMTNSIGDDVEIEARAYDAYLQLKEALEAEGIFVDLDSARRSVQAQQEIMESFTELYGADYAFKIVALPGYSEHHTGLALDLYLIVDGEAVIENEDLVQYPEIWDKIHEKLADYGFILRYLPGKEHITGYSYEPWHIRYIGDPEAAREIMEQGLTLEGYLGAATETEVDVDYGTSECYTIEELDEMMDQIKCLIAVWEGVELHRIAYAGDEAMNEENLQWMNDLEEDKEYIAVAEFFTNFHSPAEESGAWEPDQEYEDWQWWLAKTKDGSWDIVTWGY